MLCKRIIPCLDIKDGRVVKGVRFANLRDEGDPVELAARYEAQGADELVMLDISATLEGRKTTASCVAAVRRVLSIPLTVGGGVREVDDAARLLNAGADKVGVNTAAVERPGLITDIAERFGRQCAILALDAARDATGTHRVVIRSGREKLPLSAVAWATLAVEHGAGEILLTSWDRDGTRSGYDLELLRMVCSAVTVPVIASGGAAGPQDLLDGFRAGADAVLAASILHQGDFSVAQLKDMLARQGVELRQ